MESYNNDDLLKKINEKITAKNFRVGIIGLGYVGLPLALGFCSKGIKTYGFDSNIKIINSLKRCESYINHISSDELKKYVKDKKLNPLSNYKNIRDVDVIIICVPTPLNKNKEPDLKFIKNSLQSIKDYLHKSQVLILESTTYPGTTEEIIRPFLIENGFKIGEDFFLIYSPEREDPGNRIYNTYNTPKIVGGSSKNCALIGSIFYY